MNKLIILVGLVVLIQLCTAENPRYKPRYRREASPDRYAAESPSSRYKRSAESPSSRYKRSVIRRGQRGVGRRGVRVDDNGRIIRQGRPAPPPAPVQHQPREQEINYYQYEPMYPDPTPVYGPGPTDLDCSCTFGDCGFDEFENGDCADDTKRCCKYD